MFFRSNNVSLKKKKRTTVWAAPQRGHVGSERRVHWVCILVLKQRSFSKCLCGALRVCGICSEPTVGGVSRGFLDFKTAARSL